MDEAVQRTTGRPATARWWERLSRGSARPILLRLRRFVFTLPNKAVIKVCVRWPAMRTVFASVKLLLRYRLLAAVGFKVTPGQTLYLCLPGNHVSGDLEEAYRRSPSGSNPTHVQRRSVVFLHQSYYNFYYLAAALRRRGWDAVAANVLFPDHSFSRFYHGEDLNLSDPDPETARIKRRAFFESVKRRFRMVHFYGRGSLSLFPESFGVDWSAPIPWDVLELRRLGIKIGYSSGGCNDGTSQSSFYRWSQGVCDKCVWQRRPDVCSDGLNLAWGDKLNHCVDLFATGMEPEIDFQGSFNTDKVFREPLTHCIEPRVWDPRAPIPEKYRLPRADGELIVYHSVGNFETRASSSRNIKGTPAIVAAVEKLRSEGFNVRLEFVTDVPSKDIRFVQVQADVVVDQLNYGRYGANAREAMMLGRPTICFVNPRELNGARHLDSLRDCPLISATEETVYEALGDLLSSPDTRRRIGRASREYALKWWSSDACAERYEEVYDRLMAGLPPAAAPGSASQAAPKP